MKIKLFLLLLGNLLNCPLQIAAESFPTIEVYGSKFFYSDTGEQFFIKGIAYQETPNEYNSKYLETCEDIEEDNSKLAKYIDPLAFPDICLRDIPYFQRLGLNTLRVYAIDPTKNHDICMEALMEAGIYVLLDLSEPDASINRDSPLWDVTIWKRYRDVVDTMHGYRNILGFFAGNEVVNDNTNTQAAAFVKAAIRDTKKYIEESNYRRIPVGYSTNDDIDTRKSSAKYFICGDVQADFYGINMYEWCGYSSFEISGYKERTKEFLGYPVPIFFSEFGCNLIRPRPFTEINALFGDKMSKVWSGGIVYMFFEEENQYGVVEINPSDNTLRELDDFTILSESFSKISPECISKESYMESLDKRPKFTMNCPSESHNWKASSKLPPTPDETVCECIDLIKPCIVSPTNNQTIYKEIFDYICGEIDCSDIKSDGKSGQYGEFSSCTLDQKVSLEISRLYQSNEEYKDKCPFEDKGIYFKKTKNKNKNNKSSTKKLCEKYFEDSTPKQDKQQVEPKVNEENKKISKGLRLVKPSNKVEFMYIFLCLGFVIYLTTPHTIYLNIM